MINENAGLLIINKIIQQKSIEGFRDILDPRNFPEAVKDEIDYLKQHHREFNEVPSVVMFLSRFPDFPYADPSTTPIGDSPEALKKELEKYNKFLFIKDSLESISKMAAEDGDIDGAIEKLKHDSKAVKEVSFEQSSKGVDIIHDNRREETFKHKTEDPDEYGLSTGFPGIDQYTGGWHRGSFSVIAARIHKGKSWMLNAFGIKLWEQGEEVLMFSGEMDDEKVGYRFDSLYGGYSSFGLMNGNVQYVDYTDYSKYMEELNKSRNGFRIVQQADLDGPPTMEAIANFIEEEYEEGAYPTVILIDQISLMETHQKYRDERTKYNAVTRDLFKYSRSEHKPILIAASQVNRAAAKKGGDGELMIPEIHHLSESDSKLNQCCL